MGSAGIRELRQNTSALIRRVLAGEVIEITDRGRPVARIVPIRGRDILQQMIAEGRVAAPTVDLLDLEPRASEPGVKALSDVLTDMTRDER